MSSAVWIIELGRSGWQLLARGADGDALIASAEFEIGQLPSQAEPISTALTKDGYRGEGILLALGSDWCVSAILPIEGSHALRDRQTMLYRLEELIPWSAEDMVANFAAVGSNAFAVCVRRDPLSEFVRQLEFLGVQIQAIVPVAILSLMEHVTRETWPSCHAMAIQRGDWIELVTIEGMRPIRWTSFSTADTEVERELQCQEIERGFPLEIVAYELAVQFRSRTASMEGHEESAPPSTAPTVTDLLLSAGEKILRGQVDLLVDLKRGPFGRRRGNVALRRYTVALAISAAMLIATTMAAFLYRAHVASRKADHAIAGQAEVFRSIFPNSRVPVGVLTRLKSELSKLQGLRGDDGSLPSRVSSLVVLERLLKSLPTDKRFRLLEIRIEEGRLYLDGETRVHSDAEAIAQRLRAEGFEVSPPKSQRLDDKRVSLRIVGTIDLVDQLAKRGTP